jgi:hypothetical protein
MTPDSSGAGRMPVRYRAEYRSELDRRRKTWELGVRRDNAAALAALNEMSDRPHGTFSFDEVPDKPVVDGYILFGVCGNVRRELSPHSPDDPVICCDIMENQIEQSIV